MRENGSYMWMLLLLLLLFLDFSRAGGAQTYAIATLVGGSAQPVRVALATKVPSGGPNSIAVDRRGNVYFASAALNTIFKADAAGMLTRAAGYSTGGFSGDGGLATSARLLLDVRAYGQASIAVDTAATNAMLNYPIAVGTDEAGNVYVSDAETNAVRVLRPAQNVEVAK